jgi:hypothetical protein
MKLALMEAYDFVNAMHPLVLQKPMVQPVPAGTKILNGPKLVH